MSGDENVWYVKTPDGDVHRVTLDQLDEAFQAGRIDENVMVLAAGSARWAKLGQLAGLDEPAAPMALPSSIRPVSIDLSLDVDDEQAFRKKSHKGVIIGAMVAVVAVCGGVFALSSSHKQSDPPVAAAAAPVAPPPVADPPAADPAAAPTPPPATSAAVKLSDDQKAKLAAADKAIQAKVHKKSRSVAGSSYHGTTKYKSQGFTTGGNKYDPLNAGP